MLLALSVPGSQLAPRITAAFGSSRPYSYRSRLCFLSARTPLCVPRCALSALHSLFSQIFACASCLSAQEILSSRLLGPYTENESASRTSRTRMSRKRRHNSRIHHCGFDNRIRGGRLKNERGPQPARARMFIQSAGTVFRQTILRRLPQFHSCHRRLVLA